MHDVTVYGTLAARYRRPHSGFIDVHERNRPKHKIVALQPQCPDDAFRPAFSTATGDAAAFWLRRPFA